MLTVNLILFHVAFMVGGVGLAILDVFGRHWDFAGAFAGVASFVIDKTKSSAVRARLHFFISEMLVNFGSIAARR